MNRALAIIEVRRADDAAQVIEGTASTIDVDRAGDVVVPGGSEFKLPLPLLWQHDHRAPVGHVTAAKVGPTGIRFTAKFARVNEAGPLRDRLDESWQSVKHGLVRAVSIGFTPLASEPIKTGMKFTRWTWLELSLVTIPANADASIDVVRRIDAAALRQHRGTRVVRLNDRERALAGLPPRVGSVVDDVRAVLAEPRDPSDGLGVLTGRLTVAMSTATDRELDVLRARLDALEKRR